MSTEIHPPQSLFQADVFLDLGDESCAKHDTFVDAPNPSSALNFGTQGITLSARKPR